MAHTRVLFCPTSRNCRKAALRRDLTQNCFIRLRIQRGLLPSQYSHCWNNDLCAFSSLRLASNIDSRMVKTLRGFLCKSYKNFEKSGRHRRRIFSNTDSVWRFNRETFIPRLLFHMRTRMSLAKSFRPLWEALSLVWLAEYSSRSDVGKLYPLSTYHFVITNEW